MYNKRLLPFPKSYIFNVIIYTGIDYGVVLTEDDYFNFVISLWEDKNPEKSDPKNYEMLCLGALIKSNWILINIDCFEKVAKCAMNNIGILTYSMFREGNSPKTKVFEYSRKIRNNEAVDTKYFILYVSSFTQH